VEESFLWGWKKGKQRREKKIAEEQRLGGGA